MDFVTSIHCRQVVFVEVGNELWAIDEISIADKYRFYGAQSLRAYNGRHIAVYPDPSGKARKTSAGRQTDFSILESYSFDVVASNKALPVVDRINEVNASGLQNSEGERLFCRSKVQEPYQIVGRFNLQGRHKPL